MADVEYNASDLDDLLVKLNKVREQLIPGEQAKEFKVTLDFACIYGGYNSGCYRTYERISKPGASIIYSTSPKKEDDDKVYSRVECYIKFAPKSIRFKYNREGNVKDQLPKIIIPKNNLFGSGKEPVMGFWIPKKGWGVGFPKYKIITTSGIWRDDKIEFDWDKDDWRDRSDFPKQFQKRSMNLGDGYLRQLKNTNEIMIPLFEEIKEYNAQAKKAQELLESRVDKIMKGAMG